MRSKLFVGGLLASALIVPAFAQSTNQTPPPATQPAPSATQPAPSATPAPRESTTAAQTAPRAAGDMWRSSKLVGLDVYNEQNEKLGDVNEVLIDKSGNVKGFVIGVGGFLGIGEHNIMVEMAKLKFVNEPVRQASTGTTTGTGTGAGANRTGTTTTTTTQANRDDNKWVPNHAVLAGMTKDQLKAMPQFKFD
jgi:sporulation protein YlmC with PRC-barrel domain